MNIWRARSYTGGVSIAFFLLTVLLRLSLLHGSLPLLFEFPLCFFPHLILCSLLTSTQLPFRKNLSLSRKFLHVQTPWPSLTPPCLTLHSFRLFIKPQHISTFCLWLSTLRSLHHLFFPLLLHPLSTPLYQDPIHSSVPQLSALRTPRIVNLVQPQEVGHQGMLKHVTLCWGPNPVQKITSCMHACTHWWAHALTDSFYGCLELKQRSLSLGLCYYNFLPLTREGC